MPQKLYCGRREGVRKAAGYAGWASLLDGQRRSMCTRGDHMHCTLKCTPSCCSQSATKPLTGEQHWLTGQRVPAFWPHAPPGGASGSEELGLGLGEGELLGLGLARAGPGLPVPYAPPGLPQPRASGVSRLAGMGFFIQPASGYDE